MDLVCFAKGATKLQDLSCPSFMAAEIQPFFEADAMDTRVDRHLAFEILPLLVIWMLALSCSPTWGREPRRDTSTGAVRLIYIGAPFMGGPYPYLRDDPLIDATPVDGNAYGIPPEIVTKALRVYLPRSLEALDSSYDVVGFDDATCDNFQSRVLSWFRDGVLDHGLGLFMAGGFESFGGMAGYSNWGITAVGEVLPVDPTGGYPNGVRITITDTDSPLIQSLPFDTFADKYNFFDANTAADKPGSHVIARIVRSGDPAWTWWDIGEGRAYASCTPLRGGGVGPFIQWPHYGDYVSNMVYFTAGIGLPDDIELVHIAREMMRKVIDERIYIISILDFVEKFGASSDRAFESVQNADSKRKNAVGMFRDMRMAETIEELADVFAALDEAYGLAMEARDRAMLWIFVIQWLVVTSTGLACGFVLWTVMVKRRLYREVVSTRPRRLGEE